MRLHFRRLNKPGDGVPLVDNFSLEQDRHTFDDVTVVTIPVDDESDFAGKVLVMIRLTLLILG